MRLVLAVMIAVVPSRIAAAPACQPAVLLVGDPAATATISATLATHGIAAPRQGCPFTRAEVVQIDDAFVLAIVDYDGRRSQRRVGDAAVAASVIESFAMTTGDATWTIAPPPPVARDAEQPSLTSLRRDPTPPRGTIGVALESSAATDRSIWIGARARGCFQLGRTCVGGELRIARDTELYGPQTLSTRTATDLLVVLDVPWAVHRVALTPGIGIGVGWMRVRSDTDAAAFPVGDETLDVDAGGVRANVHVGVAIPLRSGIALTLGASLDVAPFAHTARYMMDGGELAGEPRGYARFVLGVEMVR